MGKVLFMRKGEVHTVPSNLPAVGTALNDMTWEEIRAISDAGLATSYFSVGDTKSLTINGMVGLTTFSNLIIDAFIIGIDHNSSIEGTNKIHFQIGRISGKDVALCDSEYGTAISSSGYFNMNTSRTTSGGWENCKMRTDILGSNGIPTNPPANTLLAALPSDLRAVMKSVTKTAHLNSSGSIYTTDYLPLLSEFECWGARHYADNGEQYTQAQYDYFKAGNSPAKYNYAAPGTGVHYYLRSPSVSVSSGMAFCVIMLESSGVDYNATYANYSYGVSPLFCV